MVYDCRQPLGLVSCRRFAVARESVRTQKTKLTKPEIEWPTDTARPALPIPLESPRCPLIILFFLLVGVTYPNIF